LPYAQLAAFVVKLLGVEGPYTLALDRTDWRVGAVEINILLLSIVYRGAGFPVVWMVLPKAGNPDALERETVVEIFLDLFGAPNVACLLGDREFIGRRSLPLSQTAPHQIPDAAEEGYAGQERARAVRVGLALVRRDARQPDAGHPRRTPDVGDGIIPQWLLPRGRRIVNPGRAGIRA
jgi:hypothetical protein